MKVLGQAGLYHCGECGQPLLFENCKVSEQQPYGIGACTTSDAFSNITGELLRKGCSRVDIRLRVPIPLLECEVVQGPAAVTFNGP